MDYIYMDNFRGFSKTIFPIKRMNFLVGENSTGKSSVLALLKMFQDSSFDFGPEMVLQKEFGGYKDCVSACSEDKSYFRIGFASIKMNREGKHTINSGLYQFQNDQGSPFLNYYMQEKNGLRVSLVFTKRRAKFRIDYLNQSFNSEEQALSHFVETIECQYKDNKYYYLAKKMGPRRPLYNYLFDISKRIKDSNSREFFENIVQELLFANGINEGSPISSLDPIRSKPQKIYEGSKHVYSPDGSHTYFELNRIAKSKGDKHNKLNKINEFGKSSGLFDSITTHSFESGIQSPFEVLIEHSSISYNLTNVGYGVSQVLPLLIECLESGDSMQFEIQQPEVHLHPRAQAAFGDFLYKLITTGSHTVFVETHSDYLIDRYRLAMNGNYRSGVESQSPSSQILFFEKKGAANQLTVMKIADSGAYPDEQPSEFREFFINEAINLLDI